jgi:hypothetical protein
LLFLVVTTMHAYMRGVRPQHCRVVPASRIIMPACICNISCACCCSEICTLPCVPRRCWLHGIMPFRVCRRWCYNPRCMQPPQDSPCAWASLDGRPDHMCPCNGRASHTHACCALLHASYHHRSLEALSRPGVMFCSSCSRWTVHVFLPSLINKGPLTMSPLL